MIRTLIAVVLTIFCISNLHAATVDTVTIYSEAMHKGFKCVVIQPDSHERSPAPRPVVYLLHGYSGNYSNWITKVPELKSYADQYGLIIVCPDGHYSSWYFDSPIDSTMRYETYIGTEVPDYIDSHYPTIKDRTGRRQERCTWIFPCWMWLPSQLLDEAGAASWRRDNSA